MRLNKYLTEITKVTDEEVDEILDKAFELYWDYMKDKWKLWPLIFLAVNQAFSDYEVSIFPKFTTRFFKHIGKSTRGVATKEGDVWIFLTRKEFKNLHSKSGIEKIKDKMRGTLTHELVHTRQFKKIPKKKLDNVIDTEEYFFAPIEIEAYARQVPQELKKGESETLQMYHFMKKQNKKGWRRFLKKAYQYVDMESDDKLKQKLLKQMKNDKEEYNMLMDLMGQNEIEGVFK